MIYPYGKTIRFHTHPVLSRFMQTTADHSHGVATILLQLWPHSSSKAIYYALHHDTPEGYTGDVPYPAKQSYPMLKTHLDAAEGDVLGKLGMTFNITDQEYRRVALCDRIEPLMFIGTFAPWVFDTTDRDDWVAQGEAVMNAAHALSVCDAVLRMLPLALSSKLYAVE
jgi:hypothetical protein